MSFLIFIVGVFGLMLGLVAFAHWCETGDDQ